MENWVMRTVNGSYLEWAEKLGMEPLVLRVLQNRGVSSFEEARDFLAADLSTLPDPALLPDLEQAVTVLGRALDAGERIRIIGDYDVDGVTSVYILLRSLRFLGGDADARIPHRILDGYGMNERLVREAAAEGASLILTCDNGISASPQIALAYELGMRVVVTDHHEPPFETLPDGSTQQILPKAEAVVNPKIEGCRYPEREICGAMVAFLLMQALFAKRDPEGWQRLQPELLQIAALGTACDVMPLLGGNHTVVKEGLRLLRTAPHPGLKTLATVTGVWPDKINMHALGFVLGPCINATGRLEEAQLALDLLLALEEPERVRMAQRLKELNEERKRMTEEGVARAQEELERRGAYDDPVYLIYLPEVHESLAGIIAGRIREKYGHPTIVLTKGEHGAKGSGRSIPAYHMQQHLQQISDIFQAFGGHAMAAGMSLEQSRVEELRERLNSTADLREEDFAEKVSLDAEVPLGSVTLRLAEALEALEPCGTGNPAPLFAKRGLILTGCRHFGQDGKYTTFTLRDGDRTCQMKYFGDRASFEEALTGRFGAGALEDLERGRGSFPFTAAYRIQVNEFRGNRSAELLLQRFIL
ncbi:MAG: single-stranded-DNA-specific exonuclease RecJ [Lachnospiraceae bacterium]|nr:single-stranded-DNA-specific exonuclease RecJ [Lachnospiraceae bacterium]